MGKMYTIDHKLLVEIPELRVGDKVYPVDNRKKTVVELNKMMDENEDWVQSAEKAIELGLGKQAAKEIEAANYPFNAYLSIFQNVVSAMTGKPIGEIEERFQETDEG